MKKEELPGFDPLLVQSQGFYERYIQDFQKKTRSRKGFFFMKRVIDCCGSFCALLLLLPLFLVIALSIKLDSHGSVFFKQKRIGKNGIPFTCYKFRTMQVTAPSALSKEEFFDADNYITRVGRFLRRTSLDELPQLFCCFVGTMSFIGPRPVVPNEEALLALRKKLGADQVSPGISGLAQVSGRDEIPYQNKALLDGLYAQKASLGFDLRLMGKTVITVLTARGNRLKKGKEKR